MEKVSNIVRGNPRVTTVDTKASAARPGMPAFGRPQAEVSAAPPEKTSSTASRAVALHNGMMEAKKAVSEERIAMQVSDSFFMKHGRRPGEEAAVAPEQELNVPVPKQMLAATDEAEEMPSPKGYVPRGSFVNVMA